MFKVDALWSAGAGLVQISKSLQISVGVESALVTIAENKAYRVATNFFKVGDGDSREFSAWISAMDLPEYIGLTHIFGTGRGRSQLFHREKLLLSIGPAYGNHGPNQGDVVWKRGGHPLQRMRLSVFVKRGSAAVRREEQRHLWASCVRC